MTYIAEAIVHVSSRDQPTAPADIVIFNGSVTLHPDGMVVAFTGVTSLLVVALAFAVSRALDCYRQLTAVAHVDERGWLIVRAAVQGFFVLFITFLLRLTGGYLLGYSPPIWWFGMCTAALMMLWWCAYLYVQRPQH